MSTAHVQVLASDQWSCNPVVSMSSVLESMSTTMHHSQSQADMNGKHCLLNPQPWNRHQCALHTHITHVYTHFVRALHTSKALSKTTAPALAD